MRVPGMLALVVLGMVGCSNGDEKLSGDEVVDRYSTAICAARADCGDQQAQCEQDVRALAHMSADIDVTDADMESCETAIAQSACENLWLVQECEWPGVSFRG